MRPNSAEARLLYAPGIDVAGRTDPAALAGRLGAAGFAVERVTGLPGSLLTLHLAGLRLELEFQNRPLPMSRFRGKTRPPESDAVRRALLRRMATHGANVRITAVDGSTRAPLAPRIKQRLVWEVVDHLLAVATPELVLCPGRDWLLTADEAEDWLATQVAPSPRMQSEGIWGRCDVFLDDPVLSKAALAWFGADTPAAPATAARGAEDRLASAVNRFLTHRRSTEIGVPNTPAGRSALYVMSATVMCFALPLGAMALTYNALGGGSLRLTSYAMAITGLGGAAEATGVLPAAAAALGFA